MKPDLLQRIYSLKMPEMNNYTIRTGRESDLPQIMTLIRELAEFERAPDAVTNTVEAMRMDGFGKESIYGFFIAEREEVIVGLSLFYYRYSTWKGKSLYLEDLIVTQAERGSGIGTALFDATIEHGREKNCVQMNWQVLDWNQPAIDFYEKYGASLEGEWVNCTLDLNKS